MTSSQKAPRVVDVWRSSGPSPVARLPVLVSHVLERSLLLLRPGVFLAPGTWVTSFAVTERREEDHMISEDTETHTHTHGSHMLSSSERRRVPLLINSAR